MTVSQLCAQQAIEAKSAKGSKTDLSGSTALAQGGRFNNRNQPARAPGICSTSPAISSNAHPLICGLRRLRARPNLLSRLNVICPVQPWLQKFSAFSFTQINSITPPSTPKEGRIAVVTNAGLDAMDAGGAADESADLADGEVVWS